MLINDSFTNVSARTGFDNASEEPSALASAAPDNIDLNNNKILIVDDDPINLIALESQLTRIFKIDGRLI